jgi:hypothetical protein
MKKDESKPGTVSVNLSRPTYEVFRNNLGEISISDLRYTDEDGEISDIVSIHPDCILEIADALHQVLSESDE